MGLSSFLLSASVAALAAILAAGQQPLPGSAPHFYSGIPNTAGNFSDSSAWQNYFQVKDKLPNITFPLPRSFAGNIPVNRQGHPNNTLFFYAFENTFGSLTTNSSDKPWGIWLNGGPGASSMIGLFLENGPIHFKPDGSLYGNQYSWHRALDMFWIDQPVGVGYSTSDPDAFVVDEDQMAQDFFGFLTNLVEVFPSLATRPLYITGESYGGVYIPYITKAYFSLQNPPVKLHKIAIGDGLYSDGVADVFTPLVSVLETYPQIIGYDQDVFNYFKEQAHLCNLDVNFTYPQFSVIPPVRTSVPLSGSRGQGLRKLDALKRIGSGELAARSTTRFDENARRAWKRDLSQRPNGTIDPFYGCDVLDEAIAYALNFTVPWKGNDFNGFDVYYIPDATDPEAFPTPFSPGIFLNNPQVAKALHAPQKQWVAIFTPEFGYPFGGGPQGDPSPPPSETFSQFARNLSTHGIHWALYSGNADMLLPHMGTELIIQNISFEGGNKRGFTRKPATPWKDDSGKFAGIIHQEYNLTYALFVGAGHTVPQYAPAAALTFVKRFLLGNDDLGTVLPDGSVVGGESMPQDILPAVNDPIFFGSGATQGTTFYPSATIAAWNRFTVTANPSPTGTSH